MIKWVTLIGLFFCVSCWNDKERALSLERKPLPKADSMAVDTTVMHKKEVFDCMLTALYYKLKLTSQDIDTLTTHYYHDILDYEDPDVRLKSERLKRVREALRDSARMAGFPKARYEKELDSLVQEVNRYEKTIVGFVLVHTYYNKPEKDTQTMIFVLDKNCGYKEAIKVSTFSDPNPEDFVNSFRNAF